MPEKTAPMLSLSGRVVPDHQCLVHGCSGAVNYDAAVFEGLRWSWHEERRDL